MKVAKKIILWTVLIILLVFSAINVILLIENVFYGKNVPNFMGYIPIIMETDTMKPKLDKYDLIIDTKLKSEENVNVGDIISAQIGDKIVTYRIGKVFIKDSRKNYLMKADSTNKYVAVVTFADMKGKYLFTIPVVGKIIKYTRTPEGMFFSIVLLITVFLVINCIIKLIRMLKIKKPREELNMDINTREMLKKNKSSRK